jgi:23S rRNA pseudouridine2605 synthase
VTVENNRGKEIWMRVILHEGRKRQIREVGSRIGLPVRRIIRVRIGSLFLGDLKPGEWRNLTKDEVKGLKTLSAKPARPVRRQYKRPPNKTPYKGPTGKTPYKGPSIKTPYKGPASKTSYKRK